MTGVFLKTESVFEDTDYLCLSEALERLDAQEFNIVVFRYWYLCTIEEIAQHLGIEWEAADQKLEEIHRKLAGMLSGDSRCSRSGLARAA